MNEYARVVVVVVVVVHVVWDEGVVSTPLSGTTHAKSPDWAADGASERQRARATTRGVGGGGVGATERASERNQGLGLRGHVVPRRMANGDDRGSVE